MVENWKEKDNPIIHRQEEEAGDCVYHGRRQKGSEFDGFKFFRWNERHDIVDLSMNNRVEGSES